MNKFLLGAALAGTMLAGSAFAAQDQTQPPAPPPGGMMRHHGMHDPLAKLDLNHDGVITQQEAIAAADRQFDKLDTNHDGKITQDELAARQQMRQDRRAERTGSDDDDAGTPRMGGPRGGMNRMLMRADTNHDGVLTRDEMRAAAIKTFDRFDTNHDGQIDQTEMAAARAKMQARMGQMRDRWQNRQMPAPDADQDPGTPQQ